MLKKVRVIVLVLAVIAAVLGCLWYTTSISAIKGDDNTYKVEIKMGSGVASIAQKLEDQGVIKSALAFRIYVKIICAILLPVTIPTKVVQAKSVTDTKSEIHIKSITIPLSKIIPLVTKSSI